MKGIITTIQRMSIHDGPGIRSTVFLKSCNLRCKWCHNPETFKPQAELEFQADLCQQCGECIKVCQSGALSLINGSLNLNRKLCVLCFDCIEVCFPEALRKMGRTLQPEELVAELENDIVFFRESGGGVTFSGGEPMLQFNFLKESAKLLKAKNIHVAIETNLTAPWEKYEEILHFTDLVMADLKLMDEKAHKHWTGSGNKMILENIKKLDSSGTPYYLRTPVVPGVNDSVEEIERIASFVGKLKNIKKYELLPFHPLADFKYNNMGIDNPFEGVNPLKKELLDPFKAILKDYKIK